MNEKTSFTEKITHFLFGKPVPTISEADLQTIRGLDQKLDSLLSLFGGQQPGLQPANDHLPPPDQTEAQGAADNGTIREGLGDLTKEVRKLAKTQFKTNTLQESQLSQQEETLTRLREAIEQQDKRLADSAQQGQQALETAQLEWLKGLLPVLDGLDAAFDTGRRQVLQLPMSVEARKAIIAWLDGIRLARMRLLDLLAVYEVSPIPAVGQPFDPHRHVAVATDTTGRMPDGAIISQDRRGYATPDKVLRFAEVVVARSGHQEKLSVTKDKRYNG